MRLVFLTSAAEKLLQPSQRDGIELAALDCSYYLKEVGDWSETVAHLQNHDRDIALCAAQDYADILRHFEKTPEMVPSNIVLINTGDERNEPLRNMFSQRAPHFILGAASPAIMRALLGSILEHKIGRGFRGISPRLANANGLHSEQHTLRASTDRPAAQKFTMNFVKQVLDSSKSARISLDNGTFLTPGISPGANFMAKVLADILDELLMNAIWDANPDYHSIGRSEVCVLKEGKEVTVEGTSDGTTIALTVEDKEGTLPLKALRGPKAYALGLRPELKVNEGPGGAGLGLFMILQRTSMLTFEVVRGERTRVCTVLRLDDSARDMQSRPKSILVFESKAEPSQASVPINQPA